jgi:hypothetical protein
MTTYRNTLACGCFSKGKAQDVAIVQSAILDCFRRARRVRDSRGIPSGDILIVCRNTHAPILKIKRYHKNFGIIRQKCY